jgi:N-acyl homoserine lactone hydrolase
MEPAGKVDRRGSRRRGSIESNHRTVELLDAQAVCFAEVPTPRDYVFRPDHKGPLTALRVLTIPGETITLPNLFFVLTHPTRGKLLVDTGLHPDALSDLRKDYGRFLARIFGRMQPRGPAFDARLRALGLEPAAVSQVLMTHVHVDHTGGMRLLPNAQFVIARPEWNVARSSRAAFQGFATHHLPPEHRVHFVDLERDGERHGPFEHTLDLYRDGSVRLIGTPGHTAGHMSILLQLPAGREVLLVGDAAYTLESIENERLPLFTASDQAYADTLSRLRAFKHDNPQTTLIPFHDPAAWKQL